MRLRPTVVLLALLFGVFGGGSFDELQFTFEITLESSAPGTAQLYYDRTGGLSEADSTAQRIQSGKNQISLALPQGMLRGLRFDPIAGAAEISVSDARIVFGGSSTLQHLPVASFAPNDQLRETSQDDGTRHLVATAGANDPQLWLAFDPPLELSAGWGDRLLAARWTILARAFAAFCVLWLLQLVWRTRAKWWSPLQRRAVARPKLALVCCAVVAGAAASYPVVFFGRSFVSPSSGIRLLYDGAITVPKQTDTFLADGRGADLGAIHWAHQPYSYLLRHALAEGSLPLWNRYNSCGVTLLGQGQSMVADPINLLVALAGADALAFDIKFVACKILFALGIGLCVWLLTRDLGIAVLLTFGAAFVGYFNYRVNHPAIFSMSYSPWVLVSWLALLKAASPRQLRNALGLWFVANWCLLASGTAKEAYLLCGALNATGALMLAIAPVPPSTKLRRLVPIAIAGVAFLLATVPQWWTFLDALRRAQTFYDVPHAFQAPRTWLAGLFDDAFYMESLPGRPMYVPAANFLILLGCLWALVQPRQLWRNRFAFSILLALLASISIAFAWIPQSWILAVPFLRNVHHVGNHFSCIAIVLAAVLAGWGFSSARRAIAEGAIRRYLIVVPLLVSVLLLVYFRENPAIWTGNQGWAGWRERLPEHTFFYSYIAAMLLALAAISLVLIRHFRGNPISGAFVMLGAAALTVLLARHAQHLPFAPPTRFIYTPGMRAELFTPSPTTEFLGEVTATEPARVVGTVNALFTGFMAVYGLEGYNGPDAIFSPYHRELMVHSGLVPPHDWRSVLLPHLLPAWEPFFDFFNLRFIAATPNTTPNTERFHRVAQLDLDILQSETAWPRAFFVDRLESYSRVDDLIERVRRQPAGQPFAAIQERATHRSSSSDSAAATRFISARDYRLTTNTTSFTLDAPTAGFAVLHETWLQDDFRVTLDGEPVPYFRVNHGFKAVEIPSAGTHRLEFTYWPRHFTASLVIGAIGLGIFAALLLLLHRTGASQAVLV